MLTVDEIKNINFKKASIGGYRADDVDDFIDSVVETVEELKKKNAELMAKNTELVTKSEQLVQSVEKYRSDEGAVSQVMIQARKDSDKAIKDAKKAAAAILKEARAEADKIISEANTKIIKEKEMLVQLEEEAAEIRKNLIKNFEKQIESLKILPDESEPKKLKKTLDEKYPTQNYSDSDKDKDSDDDDDEDEVFDTIEEAAKDASSATLDSAEAEAKAQSGTTVADDKESESNNDNSESESSVEKAEKNGEQKIQINKSQFESRFGKLKFGEDYDVKKAE